MNEESSSRVTTHRARPLRRSTKRVAVRRMLAHQLVMFLVVGAYNTVFGFSIFAVLYLLLPNVHYLAVLLISAVLSTANAFIAYRFLVFKVRGSAMLDLIRFLVVYAVSLTINLVALPLIVELGGVAVLPGQALAFLVAAVVSYLAHKHFSFRRCRPRSAPPVNEAPRSEAHHGGVPTKQVALGAGFACAADPVAHADTER